MMGVESEPLWTSFAPSRKRVEGCKRDAEGGAGAKGAEDGPAMVTLSSKTCAARATTLAAKRDDVSYVR